MASQPGPWEDYRRPAAPRIVVPNAPPPRTPAQQRIDQGNADAAPYEAPRIIATTRNTQQNTQQGYTGGVNFSDERNMRTRFEGLPDVQNYHAVLPVAQSAHNVPQGGAGDLDLVYAFAKVMDPGSVVREGEVQMTQDTGGLGDRVRGYLQGIRNGQRLPNNVRQSLIADIDNRVAQYRAAYNQVRKNYYRMAERYQFDPDAAVGPDISEAFAPGPNAPLAAPGSSEMTQAANNVVQGGAGVAPSGAVNAPGGVTVTNPQESAQASQTAGVSAADTSGAAADPQIETGRASAYRDAWVNAVNSGLDREQLGQWVDENSPRFFPDLFDGRQPRAQIDDGIWNAIQESRRTGRGMTWVPPSIPVSQVAPVDVPGIGEVDLRPAMRQEYQDQAANARGAEDRRAWAEEHPYLASADAFMRRAADTVTLGTASRIAGTLSGRGAAYEHGISGEDWRSRPIESVVGTLAGGSRLPYGGTFPRQMGVGAAYGAATDFNESDGSFSNRLANAYRGGAMGLGMNAVAGGVGRAFRARNADDILAAGERQGVEVPRYMTGNTGAFMAAGGISATPGRIPIARAVTRTTEGLETARNRAAAEIGDVGDNFEAGRRAQSGAREFLDTSERRAAQLYDRIPIAPRVRADLTNTRAVLSEVTEGLESNPRLSALLEDPQLNRYRDALTEGGLSWRDLKTFRTRVGRMIGRAQVAGEGTHEDDLRALYGGLTRDMEATAAAQGPRALTMFSRANQYWRGREARREGVVQNILGRNFDAAPEDTFRQINRWAQRDTGNTTALAQTMRSLPRDDANAVRATLFARMGRSRNGAQDETGEAFSPHVFATQWAALEPRAKALLVPNRAQRRNLDDIALLTAAMRRSEGFSNTSRSGLAILTGNALIGANSLWAHPALTALGVGSSLQAGRMLSTPAGSATILRALRNPASFKGAVPQEGEE